MKPATLFSLNWKDAAKGTIMAIITAIITGLVQLLQSGGLPTSAQIKTMIITGVTAGLAYLLKNFLTNSNDQFLKPEQKP